MKDHKVYAAVKKVQVSVFFNSENRK